MTYSATHTNIDYTNPAVTPAHPNELAQIFYPTGGQSAWADYGWTNGYPVLIWFQNSGFAGGSQTASPLDPANALLPILDMGIAVLEVAVRPSDGLGTGQGTYQPPSYYSGASDYQYWDEPTWRSSPKSAVHAVQWAKENAATYDLDPTRIAAGGRSGGAFLAKFVGMGIDWASYAGSASQFRAGITSNVAAVYVMQSMFSWTAFDTSISAGCLPSNAGPGTLAATNADVILQVRRDCSPAAWSFNETLFPGCRTTSAATPIYLYSSDGLGSTDFTGTDLLTNDFVPTITNTLTAIHDGWQVAAYWRTLLDLDQAFHSVSSRAVWSISNAPTEAQVPYRQALANPAAIYSDAASWLLGALNLRPAAEPVSERILQNIQTTLAGITFGGDYWTTFRHAAILDGSIVGEHKTPAAFIRPLYTDMDGEGQTLTGGVRHEMRCSITLVLDTRTNGGTKLERAIRDVTRALYLDPQRGSYLGRENAVNTIVDQVERSYPDGTQLDQYIATLIVRVVFRTRADDLGTSI